MKYLYLFLLLLTAAGCKKYLEEKPDKKLVVPSTAKDLQMLLNDVNDFTLSHPIAGEVASDDYYLTTADWQSLGVSDANNYIWGSNPFYEFDRNDWSRPYIMIYYANVVLDQLNHQNIKGNRKDLDDIRGQALLFRGYAFYELSQVFAKPYDKDSLDKLPGIPLRLSPDFHSISVRSSMRESYRQSFEDVLNALPLLFDRSDIATRPSKLGAYGLLSRMYHGIGDYEMSRKYADSTLAIYNTLLDYNTLNANAAYPVSIFNKEVIFHLGATSSALLPNRARIDSLLIKSYSTNDLRKAIFFNANGDGSFSFKGNYTGNLSSFIGIAIDEVYLNRAEAYARAGMVGEAMQDLNTLLKTRWKAGTFVPLTATTQKDALDIILRERRKELLMRAIRWFDLRRLNKEPGRAVTLRRYVDNKEYALPPNDPRYAMPIPDKVIQMTGMQQN